MDSKYGCSEELIKHYTCRRVKNIISIDGNLNKPFWREAPKSPRFEDLVTGEPCFWDTRIAALWNDDYFYVAYWVEEPNVQAHLTERDSLIYLENDVELFIGGEDCYYELEINALGAILEIFYIWQDAYKQGSRFDTPEFDLLGSDVDVLGGYQDIIRGGKHPRGRRWAFRGWDFPGLEVAVRVNGKLNDPGHLDKGWTVELALPWEGMKTLAGGRSLPPEDGDIWRMDFSRFEALRHGGITHDPSPGWALNTHGVYDSHIPECFSCVHFVSE
jgi:hypothetical protein